MPSPRPYTGPMAWCQVCDTIVRADHMAWTVVGDYACASCRIPPPPKGGAGVARARHF